MHPGLENTKQLFTAPHHSTPAPHHALIASCLLLVHRGGLERRGEESGELKSTRTSAEIRRRRRHEFSHTIPNSTSSLAIGEELHT